jgi:hypothetical protein
LKKILLLVSVLFLFSGLYAGDKKTSGNPPIYIAFLWHMHQPIYWPYENIIQTDANNRMGYSVADIHNQRIGPYTSWPKDAVQKGIDAGLEHLGAQVSFSGSLMENLNNLESGGDGNFTNWKSSWITARTKSTSLGNPRLDMVGFGYFHPLMGLIDSIDIAKQIQYHKKAMSTNFPGLAYSKGMFPPENAFSQRMIPGVTSEGINWILVDNIHFDRACKNYPFSTSGNLVEPNKADQVNPDPGDWVALNDLWAPTKNSARWGRQPHYVQYVDPATGTATKIIAVPADRYMGNEDGRGGFGALQYEAVMSQIESYNTDASHPILVVLHHDGDNYGGGSSGYYGSNFDSFVSWLKSTPSRFVCTTIQDYLQMYPPDVNDVIHVEDGSWAGADNGDPEFKKWLGDPNATTGYSPDRNSWCVITAAKNLAETAEQIDPTNSNTVNAWKYLLVGESSDYWYWDGSQNGLWDSHPTRAANQSVAYSQLVTGTDLTPPTIFLPQRDPYNPGGSEWNINQSSTLSIWTTAYDKSGLASVTLKYRTAADTTGATLTTDNYTYAGGSSVSAWTSIAMTAYDRASTTDPAPLFKASEYTSSISGLTSRLVDYYVEAVDNKGNVGRSPIQHVWIGSNTSSGGGSASSTVSWKPTTVTKNDTLTIRLTSSSVAASLHWGVNYSGSTWVTPDSVYWPTGTTFYTDKVAAESPFVADTGGTMVCKIGPFNNAKQTVKSIAFVIHYADATWDNNSGTDYHVAITDTADTGKVITPTTYTMDGALDASASLVASNSSVNLYASWNGSLLYVATPSAQSAGKDVFLFVSDSMRTKVAAPWSKAGKVAGWSAYLANESTNNYVAWNDYGSATVAKYAGTYLEGTINLKEKLGYTPTKMYIYVGQYGTADAGALQVQVPSGNSDANIDSSETLAYTLIISDVKQSPVRQIKNFALSQNYPNPFNPSTVINYQIPEDSKVTLRVYDVLGTQVAELVNEDQSMGVHYAQFNASKVASGIYYYTLTAGSHKETKKMMVLK